MRIAPNLAHVPRFKELVMRIYVSLMLVAAFQGEICAADRDSLIRQLRGAGPNGQGTDQAASAWKELAKQDPDSIIPLLSALDGANPVAANWIRSALDAVVERARAAKQPLPTSDLETYLKDVNHAPAGRRLAFELISSARPDFREKMLPTLLNDPAPELRFEAIKVEFDKIKAMTKDDAAAKVALHRLITASRSFEQTEELAKELEERGDKLDLTDHFGFLTRWRLLGVFDNTNSKGFAAVYPPEAMNDLTATPAGKNGNETKWKYVDAKEKYGVVDLNKEYDKTNAIDKLKNVVAYAHVDVESDADRDVEFRAASATALKIFCNGKEVMAREAYHQSFTPDSHIAPVRLKKGKNSILLKICQNDQREPWAQEWQFQMRITDATGAKVPVKNVTSSETN